MRFRPNVPVETSEPTITVDAGLAVGRHTFRLEVIGGVSGRRSRPVQVVVEVRGRIPIPIPIPVPIPVPPINR